MLANSRRRSGAPAESRQDTLYRPYRLASCAAGPTLFFRDDRLSDLIGFEYSKWHGRDAAANFIGELEAIAAGTAGKATPVVSVILDGENAWEYYPYNGYYFLNDLYELLERHPAIRTTTFSGTLGTRANSPAAGIEQLAALAAGSWVYGSLSTWIGSPDKNRAWDFLCEAKVHFDRVIESGRLGEAQKAAAFGQLADCEASDWFWWPGAYNPGQAVAAFETLFRSKLAHLYRLLGLPVPAKLLVSFTHGSGDPELGGMMRRSS